MSYNPWDPTTPSPSSQIAYLFDLFYDADRVGLDDGDDVPGIDDVTGNGHRPFGSMLATLNRPSDNFGAGHDGIALNGIGAVVGRQSVTDDAQQTPRSVVELATADDLVHTVTWVVIAAYSTSLFGWLFPLSNATATLDLDGYAFTPDGNIGVGTYVSGSANDPVDSGIVWDSDPHLFIIEQGTATSGIEVDGVLGTTADLTAAPSRLGDITAIIGLGELLCFGLKRGTLSEQEKQVVRDYVTAHVPTITITP